MEERFTPAPRLKVKKRPRGRSFEKGNGFGSEHRYRPGQSGNPGGRPACREISKALREILSSEKPFKPRTGAERLAIKWFLQSLAGNTAALVSLADRCEGRPAQSLHVTDGQEDMALQMIEGMNRLYEQRQGQLTQGDAYEQSSEAKARQKVEAEAR
jgi:hypothetical protein